MGGHRSEDRVEGHRYQEQQANGITTSNKQQQEDTRNEEEVQTILQEPQQGAIVIDTIEEVDRRSADTDTEDTGGADTIKAT